VTLQILIHGKPLDPFQAVQQMLPFDTMMVCPACEGGPVQAFPPKTGITLPNELQRYVPRQQDRKCLRCGHTWMAVLPPAVVSQAYTR